MVSTLAAAVAATALSFAARRRDLLEEVLVSDGSEAAAPVVALSIRSSVGCRESILMGVPSGELDGVTAA
jgi:hypothetical protein